MVRSILDIEPTNVWGAGGIWGAEKQRKKRTKLTPKQREYIWEHPKLYGRTCSICHQRITKLSDLELDHTKAHSKGGRKLALAHRDCNRMKASGSLGKIQKAMGFKKTKKKNRPRKTKKKQRHDIFGLPRIKPPKFGLPRIKPPNFGLRF